MNRVVIALSMARLADAMGNSILFIVIPLFVAKLPSPAFPLPESVLVGLLISVYGLVNSAVQPAAGALSDRLGRRKPLILGGLFIMALTTLGFTLAQRFSHLLILRTLQGVGVALTIPASMALMTSATQKNTRGGSMGVYSTMRMAGFAIGPLVGGALQTTYGFNAAFFAGGGMVLLGMVLVQLWVHEAPPLRQDHTAASRPFRVFDPELMTAGIIALGIATFLMASAFSMMGTLENEFNARLGLTALGFSIAFSALMFSRLVVQIPLGRLSDHIGRKPLIVAGLLLMAPATALLGLSTSLAQLTGLRIAQGVASAGIAASAFALAADLSTAGGEARQMSIITMGFGLGIAIGPLIAGILAIVSFDLPFVVGGVMSLIGVWVVMRWVPETVQRKRAQASGKRPTQPSSTRPESMRAPERPQEHPSSDR